MRAADPSGFLSDCSAERDRLHVAEDLVHFEVARECATTGIDESGLYCDLFLRQIERVDALVPLDDELQRRLRFVSALKMTIQSED